MVSATVVIPARDQLKTHSQPPRPWRSALLAGLTVWLIGNAIQLLISMFAYVMQRRPAPAHWNIAQQWLQWDAGHYVRIAVEGYQMGPGYPAFFPLYPILIRVGDYVLPGDAVTSAWIIAHLCALGSLTMLYRLADYEFGSQVARRATIYLAAFPMAFFLLAPYNTSLFLLLSISALYAARRGHWWLAGGLSALSSATRLFGVLLALPLIIEYVRQYRVGERRLGFQALAIAGVPLGLFGYMWYCALVLGNPMAFSAAQDQWGRSYTFPGVAWVHAVGHIFDRRLLDMNTLAALLDAGTFFCASILVLLAVFGRWRIRRDQFYLVAYSAATLILLSITEVGGGRPMQSAPRYIMEATVIFLVLARIGANAMVDRIVIAAGMVLQTILAVIFLSSTMLVA